MRISYNWLQGYIDIGVSPERLAEDLTMLGLEIESLELPGELLEGIYVGEILSIDPHPDADRLVVCKTVVDSAQEPLQIVCGATNMKPGDKVPTAITGTALPNGLKIKRRKMRGVESQGMMCSEQELGMGDDQQGLLILSPELKVGEKLAPAMGLDDTVFEIEVTPNRGDWASMIGVARELAAFYNKPFRLPGINLKEADEDASSISSITIEAPELCPRYIGRIIRGVQPGPSPAWLAKRLTAAGLRPINNVVDVTNYVLLETGHPLHAFDLNRLDEQRIVVREAVKGESIKTLDGEMRTLEPGMLVIADASEAVAIAGIMGGESSETGPNTTNIFLESAFFDPVSIRKTARKLKMITEASQRFQRGADPEMAVYAADRAAALIQELAGGEIAAGRLDAYPNPLPERRVALRYQRTHALLGVDVAPEAQRDMLAGLGFHVADSDASHCVVRVPSWRHDATLEADLIEEIARLQGYGRIEETIPRVRQTERVLAPEERRIRDLRRFLIGLGLREVINMTFSSPNAVHACGLGSLSETMVPLMNPMSENQAMMRATLIPGLIETASQNHRKGATRIPVFEIGPVYLPDPREQLPAQHYRLGVALTGNRHMQHWSLPQAGFDFYDMKGIAEACLADFFRASAQFHEAENPLYHPGRACHIHWGDARVGEMGEVHPKIARSYDITTPLYILEIELDSLIQAPAKTPQFQPVSAFPPTLRDMAILVDDHIPAGDLFTVIRKAGGELLSNAQIIDVFRGKQLPRGKKSVAVSLTFQSHDRTLTDQETNKACDKILKKLESQFQAELR